MLFKPLQTGNFLLAQVPNFNQINGGIGSDNRCNPTQSALYIEGYVSIYEKNGLRAVALNPFGRETTVRQSAGELILE